MDFKEALNVVDFAELKRELLHALRGKRSQALVAKALGLSPQQVYRWEAGKRGISWKQLLAFAGACHVSTKEFFTSLAFTADPKDVPAFLLHCLKDVPTPTATKVLGCSPFTLSRWKNGKTEPSAEDVLRMVHFFRNILPEALASLVSIDKLPAVEPLFRANQRERDFHFRNPAVGALTIAINLDPYLALAKHNANWISEVVGLPAPEVERLLEEMAALGIVERGEAGKFKVRPKSLVLMGNRWENLNLRAYWARRAAEKFENARDGKSDYLNSLCGYNVFPLSKAAHEEVRKKFVEFYNELVKTAQHAGRERGAGQERVAGHGEGGEKKIFVFNLQLVDLAGREQPFPPLTS